LLDEVVAAAGLRDRQKELAFEPQPLAIDGGDARCRGRDGDAEVALDQVLAEGRRVGRTAARAGHHHLRRVEAQMGGKIGKRTTERLRLAGDRIRRLANFPNHVRIDVRHHRFSGNPK
jgi:hypothetical protein